MLRKSAFCDTVHFHATVFLAGLLCARSYAGSIVKSMIFLSPKRETVLAQYVLVVGGDQETRVG